MLKLAESVIPAIRSLRKVSESGNVFSSVLFRKSKTVDHSSVFYRFLRFRVFSQKSGFIPGWDLPTNSETGDDIPKQCCQRCAHSCLSDRPRAHGCGNNHIKPHSSSRSSMPELLTLTLTPPPVHGLHSPVLTVVPFLTYPGRLVYTVVHIFFTYPQGG